MNIPTTAAGIYFALKGANIKPPNSFLDAMEIIKLAGEIDGGVLVKDYAV